MSNPLLVIQGYKKAEERIHRHWPYFLKASCDIFGMDRINGKVNWPKERLVGTGSWGHDAYVGPGDLIGFLVACLVGLSAKYDSVCIIENDSIFVRPLPAHPGIGMVATLGGHRSNGDGFRGEHFYHTPWYFHRDSIPMVIECAARMQRAQLLEHGFPDRFLGLMVDLYSLPVTHAQAFSVNTIDRPHYVAEARKAIQAGAFYVHGIKTAEQLRQVTEGLCDPHQPLPSV